MEQVTPWSVVVWSVIAPSSLPSPMRPWRFQRGSAKTGRNHYLPCSRLIRCVYETGCPALVPSYLEGGGDVASVGLDEGQVRPVLRDEEVEVRSDSEVVGELRGTATVGLKGVGARVDDARYLTIGTDCLRTGEGPVPLEEIMTGLCEGDPLGPPHDVSIARIDVVALQHARLAL